MESAIDSTVICSNLLHRRWMAAYLRRGGPTRKRPGVSSLLSCCCAPQLLVEGVIFYAVAEATVHLANGLGPVSIFLDRKLQRGKQCIRQLMDWPSESAPVSIVVIEGLNITVSHTGGPCLFRNRELEMKSLFGVLTALSVRGDWISFPILYF